jgi:ATP-binding cassette subfamily F protein uup
LCYEGEGRWLGIAGGYADWQDYRARQAAPSKAKVEKPKEAPVAAAKTDKPRTKLSYKEGRELEAIPERIEALELEQAELNERLADPTLYRETPQIVSELKARLDTIEVELLDLLERWEVLEKLRSA